MKRKVKLPLLLFLLFVFSMLFLKTGIVSFASESGTGIDKISGVTYNQDNDGLKVNVSLTVSEGNSIFVAVYSKDWKFKTSRIESVSEGTSTKEISFSSLEPSSEGYVKVFMIGSDNRPVCKSYKFAIGKDAPTPPPVPGTVYATLYSDGELVFRADDSTDSSRTVNAGPFVVSNDGYSSKASAPWHDNYRDNISSVTIEEEIRPGSTAYWFHECSNLVEVNGLKNINTGSTDSMRGMFRKCTSLSELDLEGLDTTGVKDLASMFSYCKALKRLDL